MEVLKSNFVGTDGGVVQAVQRTGSTGQGGGGDEGHHLVLGDIAGRWLSAAMRLSRMAMMARPARLLTRFSTMNRHDQHQDEAR